MVFFLGLTHKCLMPTINARRIASLLLSKYLQGQHESNIAEQHTLERSVAHKKKTNCRVVHTDRQALTQEAARMQSSQHKANATDDQTHTTVTRGLRLCC